MDVLDLSVLLAILLALIAYFSKGKLWAANNDDSNSSLKSNLNNTNDLIEIMKKSGKKAVVFYGSQTGTAEDYALKFSKEFQSKFKIPTMTTDLADVSFENFENIKNEIPDFQLAAFFMATYGEGEPTDNAVEFFDYLKNECDDLSNLKYICFGLGNSTYEFYNEIGKKTVNELNSKGATLLGNLGLGDDGKGSMDEDYLDWKDNLFDLIKDKLNLQEQTVKYEPSIQIIENFEIPIDDLSVSLGEPNSNYINPKSENEINYLKTGPFDHNHPYLAPILNTKELFNSNSRHCIHAELDLSNTNLKYSTGDHVAIWPSNSNEKVNKLLSILGLTEKKDLVISLKTLDETIHLPFPTPTTYETVLRHYLEISGPVSRQFIKSISQFCPNEESKILIDEISNDKDIYHKTITSKYYNISDALEFISKGIKWDNVPFSFIIESIAKLQPRYYSISSSSSMEKQTIHITAVVEQQKIDETYVTGVTTNLLLNIKKNQNKDDDSLKLIDTFDLEGPRNKFHNKLPIHIRRSTFKLPSNPAIPIIMIGPGTGAAPFRGFIREKIKQLENGNENLGEILFFFGCRNSTEDFIYKDEWIDYSKKLDKKFKMITAFSRETDKKVYVQDKLLENSSKVVELLDKGAFFYVCGDAANMARGVQNTLVKIYQNEKKVTQELALTMAKQLRVNNRYQEDVW
ncbi:NADPH-cytochrome P450 reductase [Pichia californica]|nr:NADPH-cytochrome P450 reductase [[Candida] californica]